MFGVPLKDRNILPRALRILFSEWGRANYRMQQGNKKNIAEKSKALNNPPPQKKLGRGIESRSLKRDGFCVCKGAKEETLHKNEQLGYKWPCWLIFIWSKAVQCRSSQSHAGTVNSDLPTGCPRPWIRMEVAMIAGQGGSNVWKSRTHTPWQKGCFPDNVACGGFFGQLKKETHALRILTDGESAG